MSCLTEWVCEKWPSYLFIVVIQILCSTFSKRTLRYSRTLNTTVRWIPKFDLKIRVLIIIWKLQRTMTLKTRGKKLKSTTFAQKRGKKCVFHCTASRACSPACIDIHVSSVKIKRRPGQNLRGFTSGYKPSNLSMHGITGTRKLTFTAIFTADWIRRVTAEVSTILCFIFSQTEQNLLDDKTRFCSTKIQNLAKMF